MKGRKTSVPPRFVPGHRELRLCRRLDEFETVELLGR